MSGIDSISPHFRSSSLPGPSLEALQAGNVQATDTTSHGGKAHAEAWKPERPTLTPPQACNLEWSLIHVTEQTSELGRQIMDTLAVRLSNIKESIRKISAESMQKLKDAAERASASDFWSILKKIATSLISAISIVFGVALVASGGGALIGGAMIASGVLSLANFALSQWGTWDWIADQIAHDNEDLKKKIAMVMPIAVGVLAGGIGIVGSVGAVATGALEFVEKAVFIAQGAVSVFEGMTTLGKGIADARLTWKQAELKRIDAELTVERAHFTTTFNQIKNFLNDSKGIKAKVTKTIELITQSNIDLARQV